MPKRNWSIVALNITLKAGEMELNTLVAESTIYMPIFTKRTEATEGTWTLGCSWIGNQIGRGMTRTCEHCCKQFGFNPRFDPDTIYCPDCADEMDCNQDGTELEPEERTRDE